MSKVVGENNVSQDLIWEICRDNSSYLVKRKGAGGPQFSRDPLNLLNNNSRKYAGFSNDQAVGVHTGSNGGIKLVTKKKQQPNRPSTNHHEVSWGSQKSGPKVYKGIANVTTKQDYRPDLRQAAVGRASAIKQSQRQKPGDRPPKLRGSKAKKAEEKA